MLTVKTQDKMDRTSRGKKQKNKKTTANGPWEYDHREKIKLKTGKEQKQSRRVPDEGS